MNVNIEKLENNMVKMLVDIGPDQFEEGLKFSFNKNKNNFNMPGFRKGRVPRALVEKQYGAEILYDDAINHIFPDIYEKIVMENDIEVVSRPSIDIVEADKEKGLQLSVEVTVKPEVTLGEYKNLTYEDKTIEVTEEEVLEVLKQEQQKNARIISVSDRAVEDGDSVQIDFEGFVDGQAFEGGTQKDYKLVIGSKSFIDTFEEQLIGHEIGEEVEVNVTFPEEYHSEELAGKPALFKVKINEISVTELPELNDEFAEDSSDFDTLAEYKKDIEAKLLHNKEHAREHEIEDVLLKQAVEAMTADVPEVMVETQTNQMINDFANRLQQQGLNMDTYMQYSGQTMDALKESYRENAAFSVRARLTLEAIAEAEGIEPTEEEISEEIKRIGQSYGIEEEKLKEIMRPEDMKGLRQDIKTQKALKIIVDSGKAVKAKDDKDKE